MSEPTNERTGEPAGELIDEPAGELTDERTGELIDETTGDVLAEAGERNADPGAPLDSQGIPDYADDASPERQEYPEPQRFPTPTEAPAAVADFGTTVAEQRAGESLDQKLGRETPDRPGAEAGSPGEQSPYEREIPPAESDLAEHENLPGQLP